jgi:hypothetical protein
MDGDGVVGYIWQHHLDPNVRSLPERATVQMIEAYQRLTHIRPDQYKKLSWPGAAMRGIIVQVSAGKGPIGILLVECRTPDREIALGPSFGQDATTCGLIWEGWV